jgi:hypothetical protein
VGQSASEAGHDATVSDVGRPQSPLIVVSARSFLGYGGVLGPCAILPLRLAARCLSDRLSATSL